MKITAITKFKQGDVWNALQKAGWTQTELAKRTGIHVTRIGEYCNLKAKPNTEQANKIQKAFGSVGVFVDVSSIWPENFVGVKKTITVQQTQEIDVHLLQTKPHELHDTCKPDIEFVKNKINEVLDSLTDREKAVIKDRFYGNKSLGEVGTKYLVNSERIRQIEQKALRKLRHPLRIQLLNEAKAALLPLRMAFV